MCYNEGRGLNDLVNRRCRFHGVGLGNRVTEQKSCDMNNNCGPPGSGRRFYAIQQRRNGTVDVHLTPFAGVTLVVPGVVPWDGMEDNIRARYYAWCEAGDPIEAMEGEDGMKREDIVRDEEGFEIEGTPEEPQTDTAWVRDGKGNIIKLEVPDDGDD